MQSAESVGRALVAKWNLNPTSSRGVPPSAYRCIKTGAVELTGREVVLPCSMAHRECISVDDGWKRGVDSQTCGSERPQT
jgi:hypothetical protein